MTIVVNFYGGPGVGKSVLAKDVANYLAKKRIKSDYVPEYAKDIVYTGNMKMFEYQDHIFAEQRMRIDRLVGKVDYAITDSPINLGHFYLPKGEPFDSFKPFIDSCFSMYTNVNFFLNRIHPYEEHGRYQTEEQSIEIDKQILQFLDQKGIPYYRIDPDESAVKTVIELLGIK